MKPASLRLSFGVWLVLAGLAATGRLTAAIVLPDWNGADRHAEVILLGFDDWAFPFRNHVQARLFTGQNPRIVLRPGPPGSPDETVLYYGTVIRIGDVLHLWYNGNYGPVSGVNGEHQKCCICYATSRDGVHWEKPDLNLVEYNRSKKNNIVDFPVPDLWSTCALLYEPDEPDPARRFKMAYEIKWEKGNRSGTKFCVAFSPDGFHWHPSPLNPFGHLEGAGIAKFRGLYYANGQGASINPLPARRLATLVSADFEHWSPCPAVGLDRGPDTAGPSSDDAVNQFEEVHLGAALWNRGNLLVGIYGQWHGHSSGDRRLLTMDLGLVLSHDGIHFEEPIRNFRLIPAREQPDSPIGVGPALVQGQGMENFGDKTLYWYSLWRAMGGTGVRLVTWPRDRIGALQPFAPVKPEAVSCEIEALNPKTRVWVNASGLGPNSRLCIDLLDRGFRPIGGFSGAGEAVLQQDGFDLPLRWEAGDSLPVARPVRLDVHFNGVRPEDARLYMVAVREAGEGRR